MEIDSPHPWKVEPAEAMKIQQQLRAKVSKESTLTTVQTVAGVDVGFEGGIARAAVVVLKYPELVPIAQSVAELEVQFPYIPGLLSFREAPPVLAAFKELQTEPDLVIFDGQGLAHPRRMGLASHLGVIVDMPSIGCAKSRLCGAYEEPDPERGSYTYLFDEGEIIGAVVRTRTDVKPLYVSIGHRIDLETAIEYVLNCCRGYKLPETTRYAHRAAAGEMLLPKGIQPTLFDP